MADRRTLTAKQEAFAQAVFSGMSYTDAYVSVYDSKASRGVQGVAGGALANKPMVKARIQELRDKAAQLAIQNGADLVRQLVEIAVADPNELTQHRRVNCRHCNGKDHEYQWRNRGEFVQRMDQWHEAQEEHHKRFPNRKFKDPQPSDKGGCGFRRTGEIDPECPVCEGEGVEELFIADTRFLSGPAKRLYAGARRTRNGIEILTHSQDAARRMLGEHYGVFKTILGGEMHVNNTNVVAPGEIDYSKLSTSALKEVMAATNPKNEPSA